MKKASKNKENLKLKKRYEDIHKETLQGFKKMIPGLVYKVVKKYENGFLAPIFNESDMIALAEDTALNICQRVIQGLESPSSPGTVDLKGANAYFKTSFQNQAKKVYEKHAKTDIRASIKTTGSEDAMSVAINQSKYNPENEYILNNQIEFIFQELKDEDLKFNKQFENKSEINKQYFFNILKDLFDGYTAQETCERLSIDMSDFLRQKRLASEFIKKKFPNELNEMVQLFSVQEDLRIHNQDVEKRKKYENVLKDINFKSYIYLSTKVEKKKLIITLYSRIDLLDNYGKRIKKIKPKLIQIESASCLFNDNVEVMKLKKDLFKRQENPEIIKKIENAAKLYMKEVQDEERDKKSS